MGERRFERFSQRDSIKLRRDEYVAAHSVYRCRCGPDKRCVGNDAELIPGDRFHQRHLSVTPTIGLSYEVALTTMPTFSVNNQNIVITDLIGFYALSDDNDLSPLVSLSPVANFNDDSSNSGPGGVAGWRSNPNQGITPGNMLTFTFDGLDLASVERWGFHVRVEGTFPGTSGNTGNITVVPTPGTAVPVAAMGLMALRRRRRRTSLTANDADCRFAGTLL